MSDIGDIDELPFSAIDLNSDQDSDRIKLLKKEKEAALSNLNMVKIASFDGRVQDPYPSPFLNLSDTKIPRTTTEIFRWCKYFYTFDPLIAGAVNALSTFPITEIYLEDKESEGGGDESPNVALYKRIFFKELNIYKLLIEIGIDYYLYGNCFVFGELWENPTTGGIEWKNMVRLDPSKIIIDYNPATREKKYKWQVPATLVNIVKKKKPPEEYDKIPDLLKEAILKSSAIVLNSNNIYHFSRPTDSMGENTIWGTPMPANVLKLLMYRNILRQAQEAIAREHIVPMRVYYLEKTPDYNPLGDWNGVAANLAGELNKAVKDPNYKVVSPVPINMLSVGGQGRNLLLTPEIEQIQSEILAGIGVPREFIFGGVSYSGSSISLKILENQFITQRLLQKDFMQNFVIKNMAKARKEWLSEADDDTLVCVKMADLKMQDDVQQKQLVIGLNAAGKVSDDYLWKSLGIEPEKMKASIKAEAMEKVERDGEIQMKQLDVQLLLQKRQIEIQAELQQHQMNYGATPTDPSTGMPVQTDPNTGMPVGAQPGQPVDPNQAQAAQHGAQLQAQQQAQQQAQGGGQADDQQLQGIAMQLLKAPEADRNKFLATLPQMYQQKVVALMQQMQNSKPSGKTDMRPMPKQKPPRRNSLK